MLHYHRLPNGEAVALTQATRPWECETIIMGAKADEVEEIVLPGFSTPGIKRPVLVSLYNQSDELCCHELSGFKIPIEKARTLFPNAGLLSRDRIFDRGKI